MASVPSPVAVGAAANYPPGIFVAPPAATAAPPTAPQVTAAVKWTRNVAAKFDATSTAGAAANRVTDAEVATAVTYQNLVIAEAGGYGPGGMGVPGLTAAAWATATGNIVALQGTVANLPTTAAVQVVATNAANALAITNARAIRTDEKLDRLEAMFVNMRDRKRNTSAGANGRLRAMQKTVAGVHPQFNAVRDTLPGNAAARTAALQGILGFSTNAAANAVAIGTAAAFGPFAAGLTPVTSDIMVMTQAQMVCLRLFYAEDFDIVVADTLAQQLNKFLEWLRD